MNVSGQTISFDTTNMPNYDRLKEDFYTKSSFPKIEVSSSSLTIQNETIYHSGGDLSVSSVSGSGIGIVFVDGNLEIAANLLYGKGDISSGLVFIVKDNVYIRSSVTEVNAVIVAEGRILTAAPLNGSCNPDEITQTLVVNGSLISINSTSPINFCRNKADNRTAAEIINHQTKYLILLKNIFSDTVQQWSEIVDLPAIDTLPLSFTPSPTPTPIPIPIPIPASTAYKRVFVTSAKYDGDTGGLSGADISRCQSLANTAGLGGTWKAWLSDSNFHTKDRLTHSTNPYKRLDNIQIADNWTDLVDGTLDNSISKDEYGSSIPPTEQTDVWTGSTIYGTIETANPGYDNTCVNWDTSSSGTYGRIGDDSLSDSHWTVNGFTSCNTMRRFYCFEQ